MDMTEEQKGILYRVLRTRWPQDCEYAVDEKGDPADLTNYDLIWRGVAGKVAGKDYTEEGLYAFVMNLRAQDLLVKKGYAEKPKAPAANLPHPDEPLLRDIRCIEDINENGGAVSKKVLHGGGTSNVLGLRNELLEKFNERVAHIKKHKIKRSDLVAAGVEKAPGSATKPKQPIFVAPPEIAEAHKLVDEMKLSDIGTVNSSMGRREALIKKKESLHRDINERYANRESAASILQWTKDAIRKSGESSIG